MRKLILASHNAGKLKEFQSLLSGLPFVVTSLADYPGIPEIKETGATFAENAAIKAEAVAQYTGELSLADDSGLEVDALHGSPGVYSARFAGEPASDEANNHKLLDLLSAVPEEKRTARFRCVIAIAAPGIPTQLAEGRCDGVITLTPCGTGGFGYDPLFYVPSQGKTFAEMTAEQKNKISHRAHALAAAISILHEFS
ncbi:MAG: XTP/dITP diphosphatase [Clostridiales bacterium]|jgi:XTP/dITP diphosphohydrolase|nr:XTP/dITP diphosphatase [Clostridiales bacterium]